MGRSTLELLRIHEPLERPLFIYHNEVGFIYNSADFPCFSRSIYCARMFWTVRSLKVFITGLRTRFPDGIMIVHMKYESVGPPTRAIPTNIPASSDPYNRKQNTIQVADLTVVQPLEPLFKPIGPVNVVHPDRKAKKKVLAEN